MLIEELDGVGETLAEVEPAGPFGELRKVLDADGRLSSTTIEPAHPPYAPSSQSPWPHGGSL